MFQNIGGKIKVLAQILCWIGILLSAIIAVFCIVVSIVFLYTEDVETAPSAYILFLRGILLLILGPLFSWIGSFLLYGYGDLIANTAEIAQQIKTVPIPAAPPVDLLAGSSNREADKPSPETESEPLEDL